MSIAEAIKHLRDAFAAEILEGEAQELAVTVSLPVSGRKSWSADDDKPAPCLPVGTPPDGTKARALQILKAAGRPLRVVQVVDRFEGTITAHHVNLMLKELWRAGIIDKPGHGVYAAKP